MEKPNTIKREVTWKDVVSEALLELGGQGHLSEINEIIEGHSKTRTNPTWKDTIRRVVRQYKIFEPIPPERSGIYKLIEKAESHPEEQKFTDEEEINHGIAQGMLVSVGHIYGYETYVPARDQTTRIFQGRPLSEQVTVSDCSYVFKGPNLRKIREIDTIWFDEDDYGLYPKYAFEVEGSTRVKPGLDRLLKIPGRYSVDFFIIGPSDKEKGLFDKYIRQTPYRSFEGRFKFRLYEELESLFNSVVKYKENRDSFGTIERWRQ